MSMSTTIRFAALATVIMLASGPDSVRFRPALTVSRDEIDVAVEAVREVLTRMR